MTKTDFTIKKFKKGLKLCRIRIRNEWNFTIKKFKKGLKHRPALFIS